MLFLLQNIKIGKWKLPLPVLLWFTLATVAALLEMSRGLSDINNFLIYRGVFIHTIHEQNLYLPYPTEYSDMNHYGPLFSIIIGPFALLPVYLGCFLWCLANAWVLFYAISQLPISKPQQNIILLIGLIEMMTAMHSVQFNTMLTGWILLSFVFVEKKQVFWATLFIALGIYVKLYGIVGLAFFFFTKDKIRFALSFLFWMILLFCLPMLISSPAYIVQCYQDWYHSLVEKNGTNIVLYETAGGMQDISFMGMIRRIFYIEQLPNYLFTIPAAILYMLPFLKTNQFTNIIFRLSYLALALIGVVIFSSSAESPTYVIAVIGIAIWFISQDRPLSKLTIVLLILTFVLTIISPTDLVPKIIRDKVIIRYSLKALPSVIIWFVLIYQLLKKDFSKAKIIN
ncbi:MAG TPA: glycosyltransferase family 87 protein [Sediminibacterium sp.]|nr:glycosyltransferase family 87 protein [Sediminibacterium sp.]